METHGKAPEEPPPPPARAKQSQGYHGNSTDLQQKDVSSGQVQWASTHTLSPACPREQNSLRTHGRKKNLLLGFKVQQKCDFSLFLSQAMRVILLW